MLPKDVCRHKTQDVRECDIQQVSTKNEAVLKYLSNKVHCFLVVDSRITPKY